MGLPLEVAATVATKIANNPVFHQNRFPESKSRALQVLSLILASLKKFIRYIQAVGTQAEAPPALLEPPDGLRDQPVWVQDLWEKWVETIQAPVGDVPHGPRLETWFTNPRRWTRCEHSRVVVLSSNFHQWERELLAAWHDRADIALPTQFAIVFPTPPDARQISPRTSCY